MKGGREERTKDGTFSYPRGCPTEAPGVTGDCATAAITARTTTAPARTATKSAIETKTAATTTAEVAAATTSKATAATTKMAQ